MIAVANDTAGQGLKALPELGLIQAHGEGRAALCAINAAINAVINATDKRPTSDRRFVEIDRCHARQEGHD